MPPFYTEDGGMVSGEDREAKAAQWRIGCRDCRRRRLLKESLVDYCRRHRFKPGEA
jgi:hypothetical protein